MTSSPTTLRTLTTARTSRRSFSSQLRLSPRTLPTSWTSTSPTTISTRSKWQMMSQRSRSSSRTTWMKSMMNRNKPMQAINFQLISRRASCDISASSIEPSLRSSTLAHNELRSLQEMPEAGQEREKELTSTFGRCAVAQDDFRFWPYALALLSCSPWTTGMAGIWQVRHTDGSLTRLRRPSSPTSTSWVRVAGHGPFPLCDEILNKPRKNDRKKCLWLNTWRRRPRTSASIEEATSGSSLGLLPCGSI